MGGFFGKYALWLICGLLGFVLCLGVVIEAGGPLGGVIAFSVTVIVGVMIVAVISIIASVRFVKKSDERWKKAVTIVLLVIFLCILIASAALYLGVIWILGLSG